MIDLRSDTLTKPTPEMREAMARAPVGDDQYGEDPTVNRLEETVAALLGKEAGLFVASGTMANQIALKVLTRPGDEVLVGGEAHILWHEAGASAANAGVQIVPLGTTGLFDGAAVRAAYKAPGHVVFAPTTLVMVENTHNRGGGVVFPPELSAEVGATASALAMATYLDGARLSNAARATGQPLAALAAPFRLASVALTKGLGCPIGSVMAGTAADIKAARRVRRVYGGAMRQAGIVAAAGLYALEHRVERLDEDHANARLLAEALAGVDGVEIDLSTVQTNIVVFRLRPGVPDAAAVAAEATRRGVLLFAMAQRTLRAVTHFEVSAQDCRRAADILSAIVAEMS